MIYKWTWCIGLLLLVAACSPKYPNNNTTVSTTDKPDTEIKLPEVKDYPDLEIEEEDNILSHKEMANKICFCAYEINQLNENIKRYHKNNDRTALVRLKAKIPKAYRDFDHCMAEIKAKYPKSTATSNPEEVMREIEKECPTLPQLLEAGSRNIQRKAE